SLASIGADRGRRSGRPTGLLPRPIAADRGRDLPDQRLRRARIPRAAAPGRNVGGFDAKQCTPARLWLAAGVDARLRPRARVLHGTGARRGGLARPALSTPAAQCHPLGHSTGAVEAPRPAADITPPR